MPDSNVEVLRAVLTKADAHDAAVTSATVARQKLATAEANLIAANKRYADLVAAEAAEDIDQNAQLAAANARATAALAATAVANKRHADLYAAEAVEDVQQNAEIARLTALVNQTPTTPPVTTTPTTPPVTIPTTGNLVLRGNKIYRATGQQIIARGAETVIAGDDGIAIVDAIAATGANAMRMLLTLDEANHMTPARFDAILARAAFHGIIVWVSLYTWNDKANNRIADALGGGYFYELGGGSRTQPAACYLAVWQRQWLKDLLHEYRTNVIIDAAQEYKGPSGLSMEAEQEAWAVSAERAVRLFRAQGYTQPLEIMANVQGRDLSGIIRLGERIRQTDTVRVDGQPQTMFGWQAYWGTSNDWFPLSQGELLLGKGRRLSAAAAMTQFVSKVTFPIQMGFDNIDSDMNLDWKPSIDAAATLGLSWLWWSWRDGALEAPVSGDACRTYVLNSANGFKGASKT